MSESFVESLRTVRRREGRRLVYYRARPDPAFWARYWEGRITAQVYERSAQGNLGWLHTILPRHLPVGCRILDAGCGPGSYVCSLRARGYRSEGIEWSADVVAAARRHCPDLPIRVGDATNLDFPDGAFDGYVSLGVMEHLRAGPGAFLAEAYRVLEPGGIAFISVPYLHVLRRLKMRCGLFSGPAPAGLEFYQYAFDRQDFESELREAGFEVLSRMSYGVAAGLSEELPPLAWLLRTRRPGAALQARLARWEWGEQHLGHAVLFTCRKAARSAGAGAARRVTGATGAEGARLKVKVEPPAPQP